MSLLPARFQTTDDMPMSLGKAIALAIAPKVDPITAFEIGDHSQEPVLIGVDMAAEESEPVFHIRSFGDVTAVEFARYMKTGSPYAAKPAPPSVQKFKVGDRVRAIADGEGCCADFKLGEEGVVAFFKQESGELQVKFDNSGRWWARGFVERISPSSETEGEGWIEWKGGERPAIPASGSVEIHWRHSTNKAVYYASCIHDGAWDGDDILAYRVVKPS